MILIIFLAAAGIIPYQSVPLSSPKPEVTKGYINKAASNAATADSEQQPTPNASLASPNSQNKSRDDANSEAEQEALLTWFTGLLVLVGLIQAVILAFTIVALGRQTAANINAQRAWIVVDVMGQILPPSLGDAVVWMVSPNVWNTGATPARILKMALDLNYIPQGKSLPVDPAYRDPRSWELIHPPKQSFQPLGVAVIQTDILQVARGLGTLYICGFVQYSDVWNNPRETRFCFVYHHCLRPDQPPSGFYMNPEAPIAYTPCT